MADAENKNTTPQAQGAETELLSQLGEEKLKNIGEEIAEIVRQHGLNNSPDICRKLFSYMSDVIDNWNCI